MVEYSSFATPLGRLQLLAVKNGVVKISFESATSDEIKKWCQKYLSKSPVKGGKFSKIAKSQILDYLNGKRMNLTFPVVHFNSPFCKKVLEAERSIPYGETRSYREVAGMVKNPRAARAVGSGNAGNPLPLYFPCHRVIATNGGLGGFGGGLKVKQFLLELESKPN